LILKIIIPFSDVPSLLGIPPKNISKINVNMIIGDTEYITLELILYLAMF